MTNIRLLHRQSLSGYLTGRSLNPPSRPYHERDRWSRCSSRPATHPGPPQGLRERLRGPLHSARPDRVAPPRMLRVGSLGLLYSNPSLSNSMARPMLPDFSREKERARRYRSDSGCSFRRRRYTTAASRNFLVFLKQYAKRRRRPSVSPSVGSSVCISSTAASYRLLETRSRT